MRPRSGRWHSRDFADETSEVSAILTPEQSAARSSCQLGADCAIVFAWFPSRTMGWARPRLRSLSELGETTTEPDFNRTGYPTLLVFTSFSHTVRSPFFLISVCTTNLSPSKAFNIEFEYPSSWRRRSRQRFRPISLLFSLLIIIHRLSRKRISSRTGERIFKV